MYVVYVDMLKFFDRINRSALWLKLYECEIKGKLLQIVRDMYENVKSCVNSCSSLSEYFSYSAGLRTQNYICKIILTMALAQMIFYLYCQFLLIIWSQKGNPPLNFKPIWIVCIICNTLGLQVNTTKTKNMVFRKRGKLRPNERWTYNGHIIEAVDILAYLGSVFNYTGIFSLNQEKLIGKALKAMYTLLCKCNMLDLKPSILCQLCDVFVGSWQYVF